jgi:acetyl coenzyme A synthetase (ADP forming)-like protein
MISQSLLPFFRPRGVVVIGASGSPEKLGYGVARNLVGSGYQGAIHFVSQRSGELFGRKLYSGLDQVPNPVDLAVLIVPNSAMPAAIQSCAGRGIEAAILLSSGFRESGPEGVALEKQCLEIARSQNIRLLGPNCIGILDTHLPLDTTFLQPPMPAPGGIGFVSHSGAFCAAIVDWSRRQGFGFSQIVSLGNQADVNETDVLPIVSGDEHTRVVVLYMEGVSDGVRFVEVAREITQRKPVIALKVGRFEPGQRAAASHTGALAASDIAFDAAFAKAGVFRAETAEQAFDWARALEACPLPRGKKVAVLTDAGGPGVIAADALEPNKLGLAQLTSSTENALAAILPSVAGIHNPVDMLASASPQDYADCLKLLLSDPQVDSVMVILPPPPMYAAESVADAMIPIIRSSGKPVVVALLGSELTAHAFERFQSANVVTYPFPERAASALGILARRSEYLTLVKAKIIKRDFRVHSMNATMKSPNELLAAYGIPAAPLRLAANADKAVAIANELGFPVVMKIASPEILHKSDIGGVLLNVKSEAEARSGYAKLIERAKSAKPGALLEGVHLQGQVDGGQEVIIGIVHDAQFGPLVMFGSGGVEAEGLNDVAFELAPLGLLEAEEMISRTWAGRKLDGFRNIPPADKSAVRDILIRLSWLAHEHPEIAELEINPLRALSNAAIAIDTRIKFSG